VSVVRHPAAILLLLASIVSCAPRLRSLPGTPAPNVIPRAELARTPQRIVFRWELEDPDMMARGEGAARVAPPDSARLDFFLAGGLASGAAVLIGDELRLPTRADDFTRRLIPPPPLLWAALGRLAIPVMRDTVVRVDGDTLRADIGTPTAWRLTFVRDTLRRIERVDGGRVVEWANREPGGHLRYRHEVSRRRLDLFITRIDDVSAFEPYIWEFP
jgi:hypothetical protein